jgi:uncharacterized membrane protein YwzB
MDILGILILLIFACVLYWAVNAILAAFSIGDPIATVVKVLLVVLLLFALVNQLGYGGSPILLRR